MYAAYIVGPYIWIHCYTSFDKKISKVFQRTITTAFTGWNVAIFFSINQSEECMLIIKDQRKEAPICLSINSYRLWMNVSELIVSMESFLLSPSNWDSNPGNKRTFQVCTSCSWAGYIYYSCMTGMLSFSTIWSIVDCNKLAWFQLYSKLSFVRGPMGPWKKFYLSNNSN